MNTNLRILSALALSVGVAMTGIGAPAAAAERLEPGLHLSIPFGGQQPAPVQFSLRLDYAQPLGLAEVELALPVALEWRLDSSGRQALYGNGLLLGSGGSWRSDAAESEAAAESTWGWNVGTILLAGGAALALIVAAAGETAEDMQETLESDGVEREENDSAAGECQVPMPEPGSGCAFNP